DVSRAGAQGGDAPRSGAGGELALWRGLSHGSQAAGEGGAADQVGKAGGRDADQIRSSGHDLRGAAGDLGRGDQPASGKIFAASGALLSRRKDQRSSGGAARLAGRLDVAAPVAGPRPVAVAIGKARVG